MQPKRQQGMFQTVLTQDDHWPLCIQTTVDQTLCNVACSVPGFCIGDVPPVTQAAIGQFNATCKQSLRGLGFCPVLQTVCQAFRKCLQILISLEVVRTRHTVF
jgi:hypothetical protein